jgi:hypothetical protein
MVLGEWERNILKHHKINCVCGGSYTFYELDKGNYKAGLCLKCGRETCADTNFVIVCTEIERANRASAPEKIMTKKEAENFLNTNLVLSDETIKQVNDKIKRSIEQDGNISIIIGRDIVSNHGQWVVLKNILNDAGWNVKETKNQMDGHYITIS